MRYQPIYDIAELCVQKGISQVVLCPGSRCAPLTLAFTRHSRITTRTFSDERSAGFVALGMAQASGTPVMIVCTSGTAAYNLAPALAEAHFSHTPLIALTADRPAEWIGQLDGQTIYQADLYGPHVKKYFQLPQDYDDPDSLWAINRMVNEALNLSIEFPRGPVHINAPFREPLYPSKAQPQITYTHGVRVLEAHDPQPELSPRMKEKIKGEWETFQNVLVVAGQQQADRAVLEAVASFQRTNPVPLVGDVISNVHALENTVQHSDLFLGQAPAELKKRMQPDLLITFGQSVISKNLKLFLRHFPARRHWHIQPAGPVADTFKNLSDVFFTLPATFFNFVATLPRGSASRLRQQGDYCALWQTQEQRTQQVRNEFMRQGPLSELKMVNALLTQLPAEADLHLANSMSVRYANFIGLTPDQKGVRVFSNRGTSGIDGCTSTAVGHALSSGRSHFLITGDLAFFYDRNAFWHNYPLENLRILLLNNHGGLIFDVLDGPSALPEAHEYFITRQRLNGEKLCEEFGFHHLKAADMGQLKDLFRIFCSGKATTTVLEYESNTALNKNEFEQLKTKIKESYE